MKTLVAARGALLGALVLCGMPSLGGKHPNPNRRRPTPDSAYYPLEVGTFWKYRMDFGGEDTRIEWRVMKNVEIAGATCALIEMTNDDSPTAKVYLRHDKDGVRRYGVDRVVLKPSELVLKLPAHKGETWKATIDLAGQEMTYTTEVLSTDELVTVPAGKYHTIAVKTTVVAPEQKDDTVSTTYYAAGVGPVKRVTTQGNFNFVLELKEFHSPNAKK